MILAGRCMGSQIQYRKLVEDSKDWRTIWDLLYAQMSHLMTKPTKWYVSPAKTPISLGIRPVWSESLLCAQWVAKDKRFLHAYSEGSDKTGRMPRLIWVFAGRIGHFVGFVIRWLKCSYLLMCLCSNFFYSTRLVEEHINKVSVCPAKTRISLGIRPVWSESSLCAYWVAKDPSFFMQTAKTLIRLFAGRTLTLLDLSRGVSY